MIGYWKQFPNVQKLDEDGIESIFNVNYSVVIDILNLPSLYKSKVGGGENVGFFVLPLCDSQRLCARGLFGRFFV